MKLNTKEEWHPPEELIQKWKLAYPKVNVEQELLKMDTWCESNPAKRKTKNGISKFCNSWLGRCQDTGGSSPTIFDNNATRKVNKEIRLRDIPLDAKLTDVSWLDHGEERNAAISYYLMTRGFYFDGTEIIHGSS